MINLKWAFPKHGASTVSSEIHVDDGGKRKWRFKSWKILFNISSCEVWLSFPFDKYVASHLLKARQSSRAEIRRGLCCLPGLCVSSNSAWRRADGLERGSSLLKELCVACWLMRASLGAVGRQTSELLPFEKDDKMMSILTCGSEALLSSSTCAALQTCGRRWGVCSDCLRRLLSPSQRTRQLQVKIPSCELGFCGSL